MEYLCIGLVRIWNYLFINGKVVGKIEQSPNYPMQLMLNLYDIENKKNEGNTFEVDYIEVYQRK